MSSSWDRPGPQRTVVDLHSYVSYWYGFVFVLLGLGVLLGGRWPEAKHLIMLVVLAALFLAHKKTSDAAESNASWVPWVSMVLALPLLLSFPIGTYLAVRLLINAPQMDTKQAAADTVPAGD